MSDTSITSIPVGNIEGIFYLSIFVYTALIIWGLKLIQKSLSDPGSFKKVLSEKNNEDQDVSPSFSRLTGAVGTMGLAAIFIGVGYWVIYAVFNNLSLIVLQDLGVYFLSGSALFAPYAFNKLAGVFKS